MRIALLLGVFGLLAACAPAQDIPNFYLTSPLSVQAGYEWGMPFGMSRVNDSSLLVTAPTLSLIKPGVKGDFRAYYMPEFTFYRHHSDLNAWNHSAGFRWGHRLSPRFSVDLNDAFYSTRDQARRLDSAFLLPRGRYNENSLYLTFAFDWRPNTRVKLLYDNSWVKYRADDLSKELRFSRLTNSYGASVEHRLSVQSKLTGTYSYMRPHALEEFDATGLPVGPLTPTHYFGLTYDFTPVRSLLLSFTGGAVRTDVYSWVVSAGAEKRFDRLTIGGGYSRYLSLMDGPAGIPFAPGLLRRFNDPASARMLPSNSITETVSFRVRANITRRLGAELAALGSRTTGGGKATDLRSVLSSARVDYKLTDHLRAFTTLQLYGQNANEIIPTSINRRRFFGGLEYTFSPTPEEISRRLDSLRSTGTPVPSVEAPPATEDK